MMNLNYDILKQNPELAKALRLEVTAADLIQFAEVLHKQAIEEGEKLHKQSEEYLTPQQLADLLHVSLTTLWNWDQGNILKPHKIGNRKYYKKSELENILDK